MIYSASGMQYDASPTPALRATQGRMVLAQVFTSAEGGGRFCHPLPALESTGEFSWRTRAPYIEMPADPDAALAILEARRLPGLPGWYSTRRP